MIKKALIVGYGSIAKRHCRLLKDHDYAIDIVTQYEDGREGVSFFKSIDELKGHAYDVALICTETGKHLDNILTLVETVRLGRVLIEKPLEMNVDRARSLQQVAKINQLEVYVAYNLRFREASERIKTWIDERRDEIRLVKILCGQYLPEWRPDRDYRTGYSADRSRGGGVDLDLSHEVDLMLWLFGKPKLIESVTVDRLSDLEINSPDYFQGIYRFDRFRVDVEVDYIRPLKRSLEVVGENIELLKVDFVTGASRLDGKRLAKNLPLSLEDSYEKQMEAFLSKKPDEKLCRLDEAIEVLACLEGRCD